MKGPVSVYLKLLQAFCSVGASQWRCQSLKSFRIRLFLPFSFGQLKINIKFSAGLLLGEGVLQSLTILYAEHTLARDKYDNIFSDFADKTPVRSPTIYSNRLKKVRLLGVVRSTGALFRASSWHLQTVQLHRELNKYVMGVLSDNFTAGFFVSFIMTVSVPDIERIQNKVI